MLFSFRNLSYCFAKNRRYASERFKKNFTLAEADILKNKINQEVLEKGRSGGLPPFPNKSER